MLSCSEGSMMAPLTCPVPLQGQMERWDWQGLLNSVFTDMTISYKGAQGFQTYFPGDASQNSKASYELPTKVPEYHFYLNYLVK